MKNERAVSLRGILLGLLVLGLVSSPVVAQKRISFVVGSGLYSLDDDDAGASLVSSSLAASATSLAAALLQSAGGCLEPNAFITTYRGSYSSGGVGGSLSINRGKWPWPDEPPPEPSGDRVGPNVRFGGLQQGVFLDRGTSIQGMFEFFPIQFLNKKGREIDGRLTRQVHPFAGVGLQYDLGGDPAAAGVNGPGETWGVKDGIGAVGAVGLAVLLQPRDKQWAIELQVRANALLPFGDTEFSRPGGQRTLTADGEVAYWGQWGVGISYNTH